MEKRNHLSIRTDQELHDKFKYVAAYEGRSMSGQVLHLIQECIREHEKKYGPIPTEEAK
jgi:hypothetical protein